MSGFHSFSVKIDVEGSGVVSSLEPLGKFFNNILPNGSGIDDPSASLEAENGDYFSVISSAFISWSLSMKNNFSHKLFG